MKIQVKDLKPNPFRKIENYPIDRAKVDSLKNSIKETSFWDNILARKVNDKYEIAYGHHRKQAVEELGIKEIDIPIKDLDDTTMIKIMANENMENWKLVTSVINETIGTVKEYIDSNIKKCKMVADSKPYLGTVSNQTFSNLKNNGVGIETIQKFLGDNWGMKIVTNALSIINADNIDNKAVEQFETQSHAKTAKDILEEYEVAIDEQMEIVENVVEDLESDEDFGGTYSAKDVKEKLKEEIESREYESTKEKFEDTFPKEEIKTDINGFLEKGIEHIIQVNSYLEEILQNLKHCDVEKVDLFFQSINLMIETFKKYGGNKECQKLLSKM